MGLLHWFNLKKLSVCTLFFLCCAGFLKYSVDVCLPDYEGSQLFSKQLPAPELLCSPIIQWDIFARTKNAEVASKATWYSGAPGLFETDDRRPGVLVFGKDILKFTVLLSKFPAQKLAVAQLVTVVVVFSVIASLSWQWLEYLVRAPRLPHVNKNEERARRLTAAHAILPDYLPEDEDPYGRQR